MKSNGQAFLSLGCGDSRVLEPTFLVFVWQMLVFSAVLFCLWTVGMSGWDSFVSDEEEELKRLNQSVLTFFLTLNTLDFFLPESRFYKDLWPPNSSPHKSCLIYVDLVPRLLQERSPSAFTLKVIALGPWQVGNSFPGFEGRMFIKRTTADPWAGS